VEGIAVLVEGPETDRALELLEAGNEQRAVAVVASRPFRSRLDVVRMRLGEWVFGRPEGEGPAPARIARRLEESSHRGFVATVEELFGRAPWSHPGTAAYFAYRRSDPSFIAAETLASALLRHKRPALDLGCGPGHLLASLAVEGGSEELVGVDSLFAALLLARRYIAPAAFLVCADAGAPLPFRDSVFEAVVCSDAWLDFPSIPLAAAEIRRVLAREGSALLPHLHNRLVPHHYRGRCPLAPSEILEVLSDLDPALLDEADVLRAALGAGQGVLEWTRDGRRLESAPDLVAAGGRLPDVVRLEGPVPPVPVGPLGANPLYEAHREGDVVRLRRTPFRYTTEQERGEIPGLLPTEAVLPWSSYRKLPAWEAPPGLPEALLRSRIVLPMPAAAFPGRRGFIGGAPPPPSRRSLARAVFRTARGIGDRPRATRLARELRERCHVGFPGGAVAILAGHRVTGRRVPDPLDLSVPATVLEEFIRAIALVGKILPFEEAIGCLLERHLPEGVSFALSFDDGTEETLEWGAPVLGRHGLRAAAFLCGSDAADENGRFWWDGAGGGGRRADPRRYLVRSDVFAPGHHTHTHRSLETLPEPELSRELRPLEVPTKAWLAYPFGRMEDAGPRAVAAARAAGFVAAFTMVPGIALPGDDPLLLPRIALYDEPPSRLLERIMTAVENRTR
jgi:SAM-dependent methyltransferase